MEDILKVYLPIHGVDDSVAWAYEKSGVFSVRSASAYRVAKEVSNDLEVNTKAVWEADVAPKIRSSICRAIHNRLAVNINLAKRKIYGPGRSHVQFVIERKRLSVTCGSGLGLVFVWIKTSSSLLD
uniref:Uncharacterized protein n=1 Tax=Nelumbo nucifera TaxID=4432 RepID=A0A822YIN7_NELNU|nr:TPA_asm: hypothetical protein HUJ06_009676 [Nelumbo nucifera]